MRRMPWWINSRNTRNCDEGRVVSNVSVNRIRFDLGGKKKDYIQIGTVMTDEKYRGKGLNGQIMERVLKEYEGKADGIYLFANDSVLNYYPKFGSGLLRNMNITWFLPIRQAVTGKRPGLMWFKSLR